jgi:hypothetical protein
LPGKRDYCCARSGELWSRCGNFAEAALDEAGGHDMGLGRRGVSVDSLEQDPGD